MITDTSQILHATQVTVIMGESLTSESICLTNAQNTASYTSARQNRLGSPYLHRDPHIYHRYGDRGPYTYLHRFRVWVRGYLTHLLLKGE